ncbi:interleukin-10 receptor subunit beta-like isoform X1 [Lethenteron reissneri]|uniref:interleukin-10 receptor subunit beta-like isoform X1 n=2 Tax=Lethenteron reissneri TaxID=7753 RepID=UPI002AB78E0F|nr:interleukin-10 receptor subunit beta-like isoform X1 [Lethenteron reissneri]
MMIPLLVLLVALPWAGHCEASAFLPKPRNLKVDIVNFYTDLTWESGVNTPEGTQYIVQYRTNNMWSHVIDCSNVTSTHCNLTKETANSYEDRYFIRLRAVHSTGVSEWINKTIIPLSQFAIGDPEMYMNLSENGVNVFAILPRTPIFKRGKQQSIDDLFPFRMLYKYSLGSSEHEASSSDDSFFMRLGKGVQFCAQAKVKLSNFNIESNWSKETCIKTDSDLFWILIIVFTLLILTFCLIGLSMCKVYKYLYTFKKGTPMTLDGVWDYNVSKENPNSAYSGSSDGGGLDGITIDYNQNSPGDSGDLNQLFSIKIDGEDVFNTDDISLRSDDARNTTYSSMSPMCRENGSSHTCVNHVFDDLLRQQDTPCESEFNVIQRDKSLQRQQYCQSKPLLDNTETLLSKAEQSDMAYTCQYVQSVHPYMSQ